MIASNIENIFSGKEENIKDFNNKEYKSSYRKKLVTKSVYVNKLGLQGDTQSDKVHHGGVDKAVCVYSKKYYDYFKSEHNIDLPKCALGENITLIDLDDSEVCLGDRYKCGEAIFEVCQPRKPCWKISSILGIKSFTATVVNECKTGFYLRVIQEGEISKDLSFELISRVHEGVSIEFVNETYIKPNVKDLKKILDCEELADAFRASLEKKLKNNLSKLEEWQEDNI